jgi:hypothetical protein
VKQEAARSSSLGTPSLKAGEHVSDKLEPSASVEASDSQHSDRRRSDRIETISPALIPLLRYGTATATYHEEHHQDDLAPAIGITVSALISVLIWAVLIWVT